MQNLSNVLFTISATFERWKPSPSFFSVHFVFVLWPGLQNVPNQSESDGQPRNARFCGLRWPLSTNTSRCSTRTGQICQSWKIHPQNGWRYIWPLLSGCRRKNKETCSSKHQTVAVAQRQCSSGAFDGPIWGSWTNPALVSFEVLVAQLFGRFAALDLLVSPHSQVSFGIFGIINDPRHNEASSAAKVKRWKMGRRAPLESTKVAVSYLGEVQMCKAPVVSSMFHKCW